MSCSLSVHIRHSVAGVLNIEHVLSPNEIKFVFLGTAKRHKLRARCVPLRKSDSPSEYGATVLMSGMFPLIFLWVHITSDISRIC